MTAHELIDSLRLHLDERHQHICQRLDDLDESMRTLYGALVSRMDEHDAYHRRNEHRWGLIRLAQRHPWRLAALAFAIGGILLRLSPTLILTWLRRFVEGILS